MTGERLEQILDRLNTSRIPLNARELLGFKTYYSEDVAILLAEIERLNKVIDSMKEDGKCE